MNFAKNIIYVDVVEAEVEGHSKMPSGTITAWSSVAFNVAPKDVFISFQFPGPIRIQILSVRSPKIMIFSSHTNIFSMRRSFVIGRSPSLLHTSVVGL